MGEAWIYAMIRLLIVDDSIFFRFAIRSIVEPDPEIEVIGEAVNGESAIEMTRKLRPDVITMDVEMPVLGGIEAVTRIMGETPRPIIMVSSYTQTGSSAAIQALRNGAVDIISKKSSMAELSLSQVNNELLEKVHYWGARKVPLISRQIEKKSVDTDNAREEEELKNGIEESETATSSEVTVAPAEPLDLVVVGISTGGPTALAKLLSSAGALSCPMVVAQHMPARFTASLAVHLTDWTGVNTVEGRHGLVLCAGEVVIAPGEKNLTILKDGRGQFVLRVREGPKTPYKPSADLLFMSAAAVAKSPVAVIMTGMGDDGVKGAKEFVKRNFPVLVQQPETCIVDGMPTAAIEAGVASRTLDIADIGKILANWSESLTIGSLGRE